MFSEIYMPYIIYVPAISFRSFCIYTQFIISFV
jgi:hypothetical protein